MEELRNILLEHTGRYPNMQPTDAVKLIYQNEFGGGHMISDEASCLAYLRREHAATPRDPQIARRECIGNGLVRIYLAAIEEADLEELGRAFIRSAAVRKGNLDSFRKKLEVLRQAVREGLFSFGETQLDAYLTAYEQAGFPPASHSPEYRTAYRPAYRVILNEYSEDIP